MIEDRQKRQRIKTSLIITNIVFFVLLILLLIYSFYNLRNQIIVTTSTNNQYYLFDLNNLNKHKNTLIADKKNKVNKQQTARNTGSPKLAIVVTNLGLNTYVTQTALSLPTEVAFGFLPYTTTLKPTMVEAQNRGHEIYINMPAETRNPNVKPGKLALKTNNSNQINLANLSQLLSGYSNYQGLYTSPDEIFSHDYEAIRPILDIVKNKNMLLILGSQHDTIEKIQKRYHQVIPNALVLDNSLNKKDIIQNLKTAAALAKLQGSALVYADAYPITLKTLIEWLPSLTEQGIDLVPPSQIGETK